MDTSDSSDNPIDLSRRCDSVETRKTPSPYNSSSFAETSPSLENDSPTSNPRKKSNNRSETPPHGYQTNDYVVHDYQMTNSTQNTTRFPYVAEKRSPPTPKTVHHRYINDQPMNGNVDEMKPHIMRAVALQHKLQSIPASVTASVPSSPESVTDPQYPLMMGRDGKMARPFKAYPRDLLSNSFAVLPELDSNERFTIYRQHMLGKIHAANGGLPTITNPKMRRNSAKTFNETDANEEMPFQAQTQHQNEMVAQPNCPSDSSETGSSSNVKKTVKDTAYFERRRKNNAAAKKSRDRRRIKEDEIAIRAAFLERENMELKIELAAIKRQLAQFAP